jgi:glucokinase
MNFLGIEIGGTKLQIVAGNGHAEILQRFRFTVDARSGAEGIREHIANTIADLGAENFAAIGVGFGGPVDRISGKVWTSYHVSGWSDFGLADWLSELAHIPVIVDNDANVAALGEGWHGAGKGYDHVFYVTLGSGVGGGLVVDKKIYHGALPGETEMGHIRLDKSGRTVQSACAGWAVDQRIREAAQRNAAGKLAQLAQQYSGAEAKALPAALRIQDEEATRILRETADDLAFGLSHVVHLLHPETIVLGGGLSLIGEPLRKLAEERLTTYIMDAFRPGPPVQLSTLKEDAVPVGALTLAIKHHQENK